jgi:ribosomal protein S18 acetylase RimI-like enzyme
VERLAVGARRKVLQIPWNDLGQAWKARTERGTDAQGTHCGESEIRICYLGEVSGRLGCVWGLSLEADTVAYLRAFVLRDDWDVGSAAIAMLAHVGCRLAARQIDTLAYVGAEEWLVGALLAIGFRRENTIISMHKMDYAVPEVGEPCLVVRPVVQTDFGDILAIDRAAFRPLWRNTAAMLAHYREQCPYFVVAERGGRVVGYQYASLAGRHGHLTRIAVHPRHHGQGIGARMLAEAMGFFRQQQVLGVTLNTQQDNSRARRLYEWFGFRRLGIEAEVLVYSV